MSKLRLRFIKSGRAKYISHLDLMRTFQRSFMRSGIKIKHTEGFNPHAYISIALPLQLGCEGLCEILDIESMDETAAAEIPEKLNPFLPEGIQIISAAEPIKKPSAIKYVRCRSVYTYDSGASDDLVKALKEFFEKNEIIITKKTKRGNSELNLKPYIKSFDVYLAEDNSIIMDALVSAQNPTINPTHLVQALTQLSPGLSPSFSADTRMEIYEEDMSVFR